MPQHPNTCMRAGSSGLASFFSIDAGITGSSGRCEEFRERRYGPVLEGGETLMSKKVKQKENNRSAKKNRGARDKDDRTAPRNDEDRTVPDDQIREG